MRSSSPAGATGAPAPPPAAAPAAASSSRAACSCPLPPSSSPASLAACRQERGSGDAHVARICRARGQAPRVRRRGRAGSPSGALTRAPARVPPHHTAANERTHHVLGQVLHGLAQPPHRVGDHHLRLGLDLHLPGAAARGSGVAGLWHRYARRHADARLARRARRVGRYPRAPRARVRSASRPRHRRARAAPASGCRARRPPRRACARPWPPARPGPRGTAAAPSVACTAEGPCAVAAQVRSRRWAQPGRAKRWWEIEEVAPHTPRDDARLDAALLLRRGLVHGGARDGGRRRRGRRRGRAGCRLCPLVGLPQFNRPNAQRRAVSSPPRKP